MFLFNFSNHFKEVSNASETFFNIFGVRGNRGMLPVLRDIASGRDKMGKILAEGRLILGMASRLDAFSAYPNRTRLLGGTLGSITDTPEVHPTRSSRTKVNIPGMVPGCSDVQGNS